MALSFENDIKPLFSQFDVDSMRDDAGVKEAGKSFDLNSYKDVKNRAGIILYELTAGDMPCTQDARWNSEDLKRFAEWIDEGMNP